MSWILAVSGEISGDQRLSELVQALRRSGLNQPVRGYSGADCVESLMPRGDVSMMGLDRILNVVSELLQARSLILKEVSRNRPDFAILVDYGGFNIRLGRKLRAMDIPVFYFVPPKIWAWGGWRLDALKKAASIVGPVFGFEDEWLRERGIETIFAGHPAGDSFLNLPDKQTARKKLNLDPHEKILLVMPGSRPGEVSRHMPVLAKSFADSRLKAAVDKVIIPAATPELERTIRKSLRGGIAVEITGPATAELYRSADFAWIASGTANLEAAWCGLPAAVFYHASLLTWEIGRRIVQIPWISPVNLLANKVVYPEFLQAAFDPENLIQWLTGEDPAEQSSQLSLFAENRSLVIDRVAQGLIAWLN